jgi:transposase
MLERVARRDEQLARLCTVPYVGPVTACAFVATVDDPKRFQGPHQLEAYLGLVPSERSSGEKQHRGPITKTGNSRVRCLLIQSALSLLRVRKPETEHLREWAERIAARRGKKIAVVALARRLAGILFAMMRDGTEYRVATPQEEKSAA